MIIRVFPRKTHLTPDDDHAFVGFPPLPGFRPQFVDEIHVSVTFSWDITEAEKLASSWANQYPKTRVLIGGPALNSKSTNFAPGVYIKKGVTFTTRGCNNNCPWCLVPKREGKLVEYSDFPSGNIIQDNNLLQSSKTHIQKVLQMLSSERRSAVFSGGLQASLITDWFADELKSVRIEQLFLAADSINALAPLEKAIHKLNFLPRRKLRVYTMIGFEGETLDDAEKRLETVWQLGGLPFAQLYQPAESWIDYGYEWKQLARKWSRPAAMVSQHKTSQSETHATCPGLW